MSATLNFKFVNTSNTYSDGNSELKLLQIFKSKNKKN